MEEDKIELRSNEVQEILNRPPKGIVRWGITLIFFVVSIIIVGSWFFKYPDIISANINLTTENPPAPVLAKSTGKIQNLFVGDKELVTRDQVMAIIENPAKYESVIEVLIYLDKFKTEFNPGEIISMPKELINLGNIQAYYSNFYKNADDYNKTMKLDYHKRKIDLYKKELGKYSLYIKNLRAQKDILRDDYRLVKKQFVRDSTLYSQNLMSESDFEKSKTGLLAKAYNYEQTKISITNTEIQIESLNQNILELQLQQEMEAANQKQMVWESYENLHSAIGNWEYQFVLKAPTDGMVTFNRFWNENQTVAVGETVMTIIPKDEGEIVGKVQLTFDGAGKVKVGQDVNIKFAGYPYLEFGMVKGMVNSISLAPNNNSYTAEISLPNGIKTFYDIDLEFKQEMQGTAEIITEDIRLLEKIVRPLRYVLKKNTDLGN